MNRIPADGYVLDDQLASSGLGRDDLSSGWLAALLSIRGNPLLRLWIQLDRRRALSRSRWLASPGLLAGTALCSILLCVILVRQLLALFAARQSGFVHPAPAAAAFWTAANGIIWLAVIFLGIRFIARLFHVIRDSVALLETGNGEQRLRLDDSLLITELSSAHVISAQIAHNLRRLLPVTIPLAFLLGLQQQLLPFSLLLDNTPGLLQSMQNLLWVPLLAILSSTLGIVLLSGIMIGAGLLRGTATLQSWAAVGVVCLQFILLGMQLASTDFFDFGSQVNQGWAVALLAILPILLMIPPVLLAGYSHLFRRILAGGFLLWIGFALTLLYGFCLLTDFNIWLARPYVAETGLQIGRQSLQLFSASPLTGLLYQRMLLDALHLDNGLTVSEQAWRHTYAFSLPLGYLLLQLLCAVGALHFARVMLDKRRLGQHE
ncbi:MAG: hypothetical protein R3F46_15095 [bacterium]